MATLTALHPRRTSQPVINSEVGPNMSAEPNIAPDARVSPPLVRFIDVQKTYDGATLVVKALNLDVAKGEFLTLLGPSGSGKTSCLMMLAGFESVTRGNILLHGKSINSVSPQRRGIGMVFQNYALFPHMTVGENLAFPLEVRRRSRAEIGERVQHALAMVRLEGFESRRPGQLSGGQQQRVAVARALVYEPEIILMDEPLGALDKKLREEMQLEIKHIHERLGVTVIYVTHDQSEALTMSDRIAIFHDGRLQHVGPPKEIYDAPKNLFVARFIGESNVLTGVVTERTSTTCRVRVDDGQEIAALPVEVAAGDRVDVVVRPERVFLSSSASRQNTAQGLVEEVIFLGDHVRLRLSVFGRSDFVVKVTQTSGLGVLRRGATVTIDWALEDGRAFRQ